MRRVQLEHAIRTACQIIGHPAVEGTDHLRAHDRQSVGEPRRADRRWCGLPRCRQPSAGHPDSTLALPGANLVVGVDDVDATFAKGIELGATAALAPDDMPGVGRLAYLVDPDGNIFGFISPVLSGGTNAMQASWPE